MRRKFNTRQRNYIILGLCSILLVMAAGYAAFRTQLNINGTSNITSEFKVLITDIQSSVLAGEATDAEEPSHTETTATFKTNLVSPGDSMQYDITVENQGDIDAVLESIDVNTSDNEAILFETTGIKRGDKLLPDESDILTVIVTYNPEITDQPSNLNATVTVTLNYVQDDGSILPEPDPVDITDNVVTSGDGLYEDEYEEGRYVYRGANPNNYIEFNNELWRIIAKETDGTYKIIRNEVLPEQMPFDDKLSAGRWGDPASVNVYLNEEYYNTLTTTAKNQMIDHVFYAGDIIDRNDDLALQIDDEKKIEWYGNIGLISISDYLKTFSDTNLCGSFKLLSKNDLDCLDLSWLVNRCWSINGGLEFPNNTAYVVNAEGNAEPWAYLWWPYETPTKAPIRPVVFLKSIIKLSGTGTKSDPYRIN